MPVPGVLTAIKNFSMMVEWICKPFDQFTAAEIYALLRLRSEVFVVEQQCIFLDADNKDLQCYHVCGWERGLLVAAARLLPPGLAYQEASIGRVVTALTARGSGNGRLLMEFAIAECRRLFGKGPIRIGAQLYLKSFYASLGFIPTGGIYPEDGIDHIEMILS